MSLPDFQRYQYALTRHLRNPHETEHPEDTHEKRVRIYADLLYNNLDSFLKTGFPVLRRVLRKKRWHALVQAFHRDHRCSSPLFRDIPKAFLEFLLACEPAAFKVPLFALELAHYEWLELKVDTDPRRIRWRQNPLLDFTRPVRVNPTLELHAYQYPVHRISRDFQPKHAASEPTFLAVWRDRLHEVRFMQLSAAAAQLLHALKQGAAPDDLLQTLEQRNPEEARKEIARWLQLDAVIGNRRLKRPIESA